MYARKLDAAVRYAQERKLGLWGACPHTRYDPYHAIETHRWGGSGKTNTTESPFDDYVEADLGEDGA